MEVHVGCSAGIIGAANLVPPLITVLESEAVDGWSSVGFAFTGSHARKWPPFRIFELKAESHVAFYAFCFFTYFLFLGTSYLLLKEKSGKWTVNDVREDTSKLKGR